MSSPRQTDLPDSEDIPEGEDHKAPEWWMSDDEVEELNIEYSIRGPNDWVISGPLGVHGTGRGRRFLTIQAADMWVKQKYGRRAKYRIAEAQLNGGNRWAYLIKGD